MEAYEFIAHNRLITRVPREAEDGVRFRVLITYRPSCTAQRTAREAKGSSHIRPMHLINHIQIYGLTVMGCYNIFLTNKIIVLTCENFNATLTTIMIDNIIFNPVVKKHYLQI